MADFVERIIAVKKPSANLMADLLFSYELIGKDFGYQKLNGQAMLLLYKNEGSAAFEIQFGSRGDFLTSLRKLIDNKADVCFFVTSSRAHTMRLEDVRYLLLKNFNIGKQKFVIIDIETNRALKINFEWDKFEQGVGKERGQVNVSESRPLFRGQQRSGGRHKKIFGHRGEHKEQD